MNLAITSTSLY